MKVFWDQHNPWRDHLVYVYMDDLLGCLYDPAARKLNKSNWLKYGNALDCYIIKSGDDTYHMGIRYGEEPHAYLSPHGNQEKMKSVYESRKCL